MREKRGKGRKVMTEVVLESRMAGKVGWLGGFDFQKTVQRERVD